MVLNSRKVWLTAMHGGFVLVCAAIVWGLHGIWVNLHRGELLMSLVGLGFCTVLCPVLGWIRDWIVEIKNAPPAK